MWSSDKWKPGEKSLIKTWEFHKGLLLHGIKILFLSYLMNVSGQIMLNATYMHNQMTYLWQGPQITVYKCVFFILQFSDKRGTKLSDSELQQIHLSCVWGVPPPAFSLGLGDRVFGLHWWLQQLEACSSSQHLEPFCWLCIAEPSRHSLSGPWHASYAINHW